MRPPAAILAALLMLPGAPTVFGPPPSTLAGSILEHKEAAMARRSTAGLLAGLAFLLAAGPAPAQSVDFQWTGPVPAGGSIRVFSGNGPIDVVPAAGDRVEVVAERREARRDQDPVRFEVLELGSDVVVCAVTDRTECRPDGIRSIAGSAGNSPESVRFSVRAPAGVHVRLGSGNGALTIEAVGGDVVARTGNGRTRVLGTSGTVEVHSGNGAIEIARATGRVRAHTGSGRIDVRTARGPISASSGNGRILVDLDSLEGDGDLEFRTGSGHIELRLPTGLNADLVTRLGNGRVESDFPLVVEGRMDFRNLRARIGEGGRRLVASSGNGDVTLRRR